MLRRLFIMLFICTSIFTFVRRSNAQCAMCTANAEQGLKNGNTQTKGINSGVLYLLAIPFLLAGGVGVLWYTSYRKKDTGKLA